LTIIKHLSNPSMQCSVSSFIIREALEAAKKLPAEKFRHINGEQNQIVHELAHLAKRCSTMRFGPIARQCVLSILFSGL
ncbi:hypothetical protein BAE44_0018441, partial [Dichanthelium oligosanthes]